MLVCCESLLINSLSEGLASMVSNELYLSKYSLIFGLTISAIISLMKSTSSEEISNKTILAAKLLIIYICSSILKGRSCLTFSRVKSNSKYFSVMESLSGYFSLKPSRGSFFNAVNNTGLERLLKFILLFFNISNFSYPSQSRRDGSDN